MKPASRLVMLAAMALLACWPGVGRTDDEGQSPASVPDEGERGPAFKVCYENSDGLEIAWLVPGDLFKIRTRAGHATSSAPWLFRVSEGVSEGAAGALILEDDGVTPQDPNRVHYIQPDATQPDRAIVAQPMLVLPGTGRLNITVSSAP